MLHGASVASLSPTPGQGSLIASRSLWMVLLLCWLYEAATSIARRPCRARVHKTSGGTSHNKQASRTPPSSRSPCTKRHVFSQEGPLGVMRTCLTLGGLWARMTPCQSRQWSSQGSWHCWQWLAVLVTWHIGAWQWLHEFLNRHHAPGPGLRAHGLQATQ